MAARPEHPRVCGENANHKPDSQVALGTSPRMRGKLPSPRQVRGIERNIPAYAGKTLENKNITESLAEHPRVCGENASINSTIGGRSGTSPRMRGKLL